MTMTDRSICKWCGVYDDDHGYDVLATQCYPAQVAAKDAEIERLRAALADMIDFAEHASPYALSTNSKERIAKAKALIGTEQRPSDYASEMEREHGPDLIRER